MPIKIVDLFSGPGGLAEGFASLNEGKAFSIAVSAEMEASAHNTLTLRAFFRLSRIAGDLKAISAYYEFCNSPLAKHPLEVCPFLWAAAKLEARQLTLGDSASNETLDGLIVDQKLSDNRTVLIGGPPCQAYSLVGRARNKGKSGYVAEADDRHFLYREYLRILASTRPAVFVMENVKGILSSKVAGRQIFHDILTDLCDPVKAVNGGSGPKYVIHSLTTATNFQSGMEAADVDARDSIIRSENYGIPQARHRVILLGIREDIPHHHVKKLSSSSQLTVRDAISDLPSLRSRLKKDDSSVLWRDKVVSLGQNLVKEALKERKHPLVGPMTEEIDLIKFDLSEGGLRFPKTHSTGRRKSLSLYEKWVNDEKIRVWLNHETRSHMDSDLGRYFYASVFAAVNERSPKGHLEFSLKGLAPAHANWESGKFSDRFRVQRFDAPSTTVTSHIAKDGHYFIHPDPAQCRSLTVREAARLQTFPYNYFFQGNKTQQYHQVGNAVPPLLASRIAEIVFSVFNDLC
jgi:DNA (cytosine-5)-methyltransferase 1